MAIETRANTFVSGEGGSNGGRGNTAEGGQRQRQEETVRLLCEVVGQEAEQLVVAVGSVVMTACRRTATIRGRAVDFVQLAMRVQCD